MLLGALDCGTRPQNVAEYAKGPGEAISPKAQSYTVGRYTNLALLHMGCEMTTEPKGF